MKKFVIIFTAVFLTQIAEASLLIKPGKWRVETSISQNGKAQVDPMAKFKEAMKNMSPEKKKQMDLAMAEMAKKLGQTPKAQNKKMPKFAFDQEGMTICYSKEMLESGLDVKKKQEAQKCKVFDHKVTSTKISMKFKCDNGSSGNSEWNVIDDTHLKGTTTTSSGKGDKSEIKYQAKFISNKCD